MKDNAPRLIRPWQICVPKHRTRPYTAHLGTAAAVHLQATPSGLPRQKANNKHRGATPPRRPQGGRPSSTSFWSFLPALPEVHGSSQELAGIAVKIENLEDGENVQNALVKHHSAQPQRCPERRQKGLKNIQKIVRLKTKCHF